MTNSHPTPPPKFPSYIFLLSDHETLELACDIAKELEKLDSELVSWDFLAPIYEAITSFVGTDWAVDLGDPRKHSHGDHIKSLAAWAETEFGDNYFGLAAFKEVHESIALGYDRTIVFRDARWIDIEPFLKTFKPHEFVIVDLKPLAPNTSVTTGRWAGRHLLFATPTVESIVAAIIEASK